MQLPLVEGSTWHLVPILAMKSSSTRQFIRNRSHASGGLHYAFLQGVGSGADLLLINSEFVENLAQLSGGASIYSVGKWRSIFDTQISSVTGVQGCCLN